MQPYKLDLNKATELLQQDGWIYNLDGSPYDLNVRGLDISRLNDVFIPELSYGGY